MRFLKFAGFSGVLRLAHELKQVKTVSALSLSPAETTGVHNALQKRAGATRDGLARGAISGACEASEADQRHSQPTCRS